MVVCSLPPVEENTFCNVVEFLYISFWVNVFYLQFDTVPDTTSSPNTITLKAFSMRMEVRLRCEFHTTSHHTT